MGVHLGAQGLVAPPFKRRQVSAMQRSNAARSIPESTQLLDQFRS